MTRLWTAAVFAAMLAAPLVSATSTAASPLTPGRMGSDSLVGGSQSASTIVLLTHDASTSVSGVDDPDFKIAGGGRFAGLTLRGIDHPEITVAAVRVNFCFKMGCTGHERPAAQLVFIEAPATRVGQADRFTLPAGRYRLQLIADHASVQVRVHLAGLTGATRIWPTGPVQVQIADPVTSIPAPVAASAFAGAERKSDKILMVDQEAFHATADAQHLVGSCYYLNVPPPQLGPAPGCPGATGSGPALNEVLLQLNEASGYYGYAQADRAPGHWTQGYYQHGVELLKDLHVGFLWIDL